VRSEEIVLEDLDSFESPAQPSAVTPKQNASTAPAKPTQIDRDVLLDMTWLDSDRPAPLLR